MPRMLDAFKVELEKHSELDVIERLELSPRAERRTPFPIMSDNCRAGFRRVEARRTACSYRLKS